MMMTNKTQEEILAFAVAQIENDSSAILPTCCNEHKQFAWVSSQLFTLDVAEIPELETYLRDEICLN